MSITTTTHLNFRGNAQSALAFYHGVFGGLVTLANSGHVGMPADAPGADNVLFGQVESEHGFRVMASDIPGQASGAPPNTGATGIGTTSSENGVTITEQPFFPSVHGRRWRKCRATGRGSPWARRSSSPSPRPHEAPASGCSPTPSA